MKKIDFIALSGVALALAAACSSDTTNSNSSAGGAPNGGQSAGGALIGGAGGVTMGAGGATVGGSSSGGVSVGGTGTGGGFSMGTGGGISTGGSGASGASSGGSGAGGASGGGAATGGAQSGGAGGGGGGVDLTGTWVSEVKTSGKLNVPIVGMTNADIDLVIRLSLSKSGGKLNGAFNICRLATTTTPDPNSLKVTFTPAVIATLSTTTSENDFTATVGGAVPVPDLTVISGMDAMSKQVDSDKDMNPGVTLPSNIGGVIVLNAYVGLTIKVSLTATLKDANTITGTTSFTTTGTVFGSDNPLLTMGSIDVTPDSMAIPLTSTRLMGDVACADVVKMFP